MAAGAAEASASGEIPYALFAEGIIDDVFVELGCVPAVRDAPDVDDGVHPEHLQGVDESLLGTDPVSDAVDGVHRLPPVRDRAVGRGGLHLGGDPLRLLLAEPLKVVDVAYRCALQAFLISEIPRVQFPAGPLSLVKKARKDVFPDVGKVVHRGDALGDGEKAPCSPALLPVVLEAGVC